MPNEKGSNQLADLEKQVEGLVSQIDEALKMKKEDNTPPTDDKVEKNENEELDVEQRLEGAAQLLGLEKADLVALLSKAKADDSCDEPDADDEPSNPGKFPFKAKKAAEPEEDKEETESVEIHGQTISKAAVGEAVFEVLKAQSAEIAKQREDIQKAKDEAEMERLRKRADDVYAHVPGTTEERAAMLKAMSGLPKEVAKNLEKVFVQSEKLAKSAFEKIGHQGGGDPAQMMKSKQDFENKVTEIAKRDSISRTAAMAKARQEDPEAFKAYQGN